jgi:hypothetical protein
MHALKYNNTLKGLDVSNNNIFEDGVKKISELLLENDSLCELVLNGKKLILKTIYKKTIKVKLLK